MCSNVVRRWRAPSTTGTWALAHLQRCSRFPLSTLGGGGNRTRVLARDDGEGMTRGVIPSLVRLISLHDCENEVGHPREGTEGHWTLLASLVVGHGAALVDRKRDPSAPLGVTGPGRVELPDQSKGQMIQSGPKTSKNVTDEDDGSSRQCTGRARRPAERDMAGGWVPRVSRA